MCLIARSIMMGVLVAVFAPVGASAPVPADRAKVEKELAAVATKLHGSWQGGPCEGEVTFRADRTYEWTGIGPGGNRHEGTWTLRGDPARPTLVMACKKADELALEGKTTELAVVRVGEEFEFKRPDAAKPQTFERTKNVLVP